MIAKKNIDKKVVKIINEVKQLCGLLFGDKLHDIYLFGSYARGDYDEESDVDIMLTLDLTEKQIYKHRNSLVKIASRLSLKYDITVSVLTNSTKTFYKYTEFIPFYQNVVNEGINYGNSR